MTEHRRDTAVARCEVAKAKSEKTNRDSFELPLRLGGEDSHDKPILARKRDILASLALEVPFFSVVFM